MTGSRFLVLISADAEWAAMERLFPGCVQQPSPYGAWFRASIDLAAGSEEVVFFQGGWGKISAAASTQYVIDHFAPALLINLGTCGGFAGKVERGEVLFVERTLVYDIYEQMGDPIEHLLHYAVQIDTDWASPQTLSRVRKSLLVSADRDIIPGEIEQLQSRFKAIAADWESGAIAFVAKKNQQPILILRAVTDLVSSSGGEAYGKLEQFQGACYPAMENLVSMLPQWLECWKNPIQDRPGKAGV